MIKGHVFGLVGDLILDRDRSVVLGVDRRGSTGRGVDVLLEPLPNEALLTDVFDDGLHDDDDGAWVE